MKVYLDTGVFIDYLSARGPAGAYLRKEGRSGRTLTELAGHAEQCLDKISRDHNGLTSSLTFYEVEEALYGQLASSTKGVAHGGRYVVPAARSIMIQMLIVVELFGIQVIDLTRDIVGLQLGQLLLQTRGVRAADALHVTSAILTDGDVVLSTDEHMLNLDGIICNSKGKPIRFWDTDAALTHL